MLAPEIDQLAQTLAEAMAPVGPAEAELALSIYAGLSGGGPVSAGQLADGLGREEADVAAELRSWPGAFFDGDGRVDSFWGLSVAETPHRFRVGGRQLYTWCGWDALFIPELIGEAAEVESQPPNGRTEVRLVVEPAGVRDAVPPGAVVSMLSPSEVFDENVLMSFCHFVHFFPSAAAGESWVSEYEGTFLLSVHEAHELGRLVNRRRFGAVALGGLSGD